MRRLILLGFLISRWPIHAGCIDVTGQSSVTLAPGASLLFHIGIWNFATYTGTYPDRINFSLASLPLTGGTGGFRASLESLDGTVSASLYALGYQAEVYPAGGTFTSGDYTGPVSILQAGAPLTSAQSAALFGAGALVPGSDGAVIRIDNLGGSTTFSWPNGSVRNALHTSLEGPWLSIGAAGGVVELLEAPEPDTLSLLLAGLGIAGLARVLCKKRKRSSSHH